MIQSSYDFLILSVLTGEIELLEIKLKDMNIELTNKQGELWNQSHAYIEFYKDDIRDIEKLISWMKKRIKQIKE